MEIRGANIAWGEGQIVDLLDLAAAPISIEDYAYALAYTVRWRGQARSAGMRMFYGVAEHCWRGAVAIMDHSGGEAVDLALAFLGHEADEVVFGDLAGPAKQLFHNWRDVSKTAGGQLNSRFNFPEVDKGHLKYWDDRLLVTEKRDLMGHEQSYISADGSRMVDIDPLPDVIVPFQHPDLAAISWLQLYYDLGGRDHGE